MRSEDETCRSCGHTFEWHQDNTPRHPFNYGQDGATGFLGKRRDRTTQPGQKTSQRGSDSPQIAAMPTDPVLRIALINRGMLTPADLMAAEQQLREAFSHIREESWSATGVVSTDSSTETGKTSTEH